MAKQITFKQKNFCNAYIDNGGNASKAYETAYGRINGARQAGHLLLTKCYIKEYIQRRNEVKRQESESKQEITAEFIRTELLNEYDQVAGKDHQAALRALELLGKTIGIFKEGVEFTDTIKQSEIDAEEREELRVLAKIRIAQGMSSG